jgi:hypothetical protein
MARRTARMLARRRADVRRRMPQLRLRRTFKRKSTSRLSQRERSTLRLRSKQPEHVGRNTGYRCEAIKRALAFLK